MLAFDIGANVGRWSLANIGRFDKIVAVEGSPPTFERLKQACAGTSIVPLNLVVCDNDGKEVVFFNAASDTLSTLNREWLESSASRFCGTPYTEIRCPTTTLDALVAQYGVPDLIKIDVEGGEYECIRSLTTKAGVLCFEWASETQDVACQCIDHLTSLGYNRFHVQRGDDYTYRPLSHTSNEEVRRVLSRSVPRVDWGMVWCSSA